MRLRGGKGDESSPHTPVYHQSPTKRLQPSEVLHMTTRAVSRVDSAASASAVASIVSDDSPTSCRRESVSTIGGDDYDNGRPAKIARMMRQPQSVDPEVGISDRNAGMSSSSHEDMLDVASAAHGSSFPAHTRLDNADSDIDGVQDSIETSAKLGSRIMTFSRRGKRPKGWHMRRENRHLLKSTSQHSASRSDKPLAARSQSPSQYETGGIMKKLPGRRRAPHPDNGIEADLRRQLELKVAYRAVVKALKPVLAELADRTARELEADDHLHMRYAEYDVIQAELDARLQERLDVVHGEMKEEQARLERIQAAEEEMLNRRYRLTFLDARDDFELFCQKKFLSVMREKNKEGDEYATDDEDGVLPPVYRVMKPKFQREVIPKPVNSHSQQYLEIEHHFDWSGARCHFMDELRKFDESCIVRHPKGFAVFDSDLRKEASIHHNLNRLSWAGDVLAESDAMNARKASNAAAVGLQALVKASEMLPVMVPQQLEIIQNRQVEHMRRGDPPLGYQAYSNGEQAGRRPTSPSPRKRHRRPNQKKSGPEAQYQAQAPLTRIITQHPQEHGYEQLPYAPYPPVQGVPPQSHIDAYKFQRSMEQGAYGYGLPGTDPILINDNRNSVTRQDQDPNSTTVKSRRRPGPRAIYTSNKLTGTKTAPALQVAQNWSPFTNTMGPPTYLPKYIRGSEDGQSGNYDDPMSPFSGVPNHPNDEHRANDGQQYPSRTSMPPDPMFTPQYDQPDVQPSPKPAYPPYPNQRRPSRESYVALDPRQQQREALQRPLEFNQHHSAPPRPPSQAGGFPPPQNVYYQPNNSHRFYPGHHFNQRQPDSRVPSPSAVHLRREPVSQSPSVIQPANMPRPYPVILSGPNVPPPGPAEPHLSQQQMNGAREIRPRTPVSAYGSRGQVGTFGPPGPLIIHPELTPTNDEHHMQHSQMYDGTPHHHGSHSQSQGRRPSNLNPLPLPPLQPYPLQPRSRQNTTSLTTYPGQKFGQQLLPATLDPNRPPPSSIHGSYHHSPYEYPPPPHEYPPPPPLPLSHHHHHQQQQQPQPQPQSQQHSHQHSHHQPQHHHQPHHQHAPSRRDSGRATPRTPNNEAQPHTWPGFPPPMHPPPKVQSYGTAFPPSPAIYAQPDRLRYSAPYNGYASPYEGDPRYRDEARWATGQGPGRGPERRRSSPGAQRSARP